MNLYTKSKQSYLIAKDYRNLVIIVALYSILALFGLGELQSPVPSSPPLGRLITELSIRLGGETAQSYFILSAAAGILMLGVIYTLAKRIFKETQYATLATLLFALDGIHFTQTISGTSDNYFMLFSLLAYLFIYQYISCKADKDYVKMNLNLLASGLFMGASLAVKWDGIYMSISILIIFIVSCFINNKYYNRHGNWYEYRMRIIGKGILYLIVMPIIIYILTYIPDMVENPSLRNPKVFLDAQYALYKARQEMLMPHTFMWYYTNPFLWWTGIIGVFYCILKTVFDKEIKCFYIILPIVASLIPYIVASQIKLVCYDSMIIPFLILAMVSWLKSIREKWGIKGHIIGYCLVVILVFIALYPIYIGRSSIEGYIDLIQQLPSYLIR